MTRLLRKLSFFAVAAILLASCGSVYAQVYSYLDENGVRILTNTPPARKVDDLKVSCVPQPAPVPRSAARVSGKNAKADSKTAEAASAYTEVIEKYSNTYGVDPNLIHAMMATESAFNPKAVSPKGAQGLMQLMPDTAARLGVRDPFDPEQNIEGGIKYMRSLLDMFAEYPDTLILSLAAYNAGENLVQRLGRIPAIKETNDYVRSIIARYGSRTTEVRAVAQDAPPAPPMMFSYPDENGVLVYTNIPPVQSGTRIGGGPGSRYR